MRKKYIIVMLTFFVCFQLKAQEKNSSLDKSIEVIYNFNVNTTIMDANLNGIRGLRYRNQFGEDYFFRLNLLGLYSSNSDFVYNNFDISQKGTVDRDIVGFGLGVGIEKHRTNSNKMNLYYGGQLQLEFANLNEVGKGTTDGLNYLNGGAYTYSRSGSFSIDTRIFTGAEYNINTQFYIGIEFGISTLYSSLGTEEYWDNMSGRTLTTRGGSSFGIGLTGDQGFRLGYRF